MSERVVGVVVVGAKKNKQATRRKFGNMETSQLTESAEQRRLKGWFSPKVENLDWVVPRRKRTTYGGGKGSQNGGRTLSIIILCDVYITKGGRGWGKTKANSISALLKSAP